jgi:glyoxylase-like metal-dependent hydrolase (beta-lactamase superfamily II)
VDVFNPILRQTFPAAAANELPDLTFSDRVTLHLNGEAVTAHHVPRGHTDGDVIVHFTGSNVLHMGDIFFNGLYPFIDLDAGGTVQGTIAAVEKGLELADESTRVIPGHGPLATREDLVAYRDFLVAARDRVQALADAGNSLQQAIAARPTAEWDDTLGAVWITPEQFVTFIYNSLAGVDHFTLPDGSRVVTE